MWSHISSWCWKSQKMYEVKQPHFVPWIPGSHCVCKHIIKQCLPGMWLSCVFQFLVHPLSGCDSISYIYVHILFEGMVWDANTIPEEWSGPLKAAYSFLFVQLLLLMCHVNLAQHKFQTLCAMSQTSVAQSSLLRQFWGRLSGQLC